MPTSSDLREKVAEILGWSAYEANGFSLPTLREFVRPLSKKLADEITAFMRSDRYIVCPVERKRRRH